jgi:hypothetical protein
LTTPRIVRFNNKITLPYEPFLGTLGVSPEIEAVTSLQPDYWGGNMDVPDVGPGAILYFPVLHKDAYLYLGDCHATQGDGELCGVAVEMKSTTTIQVDVIKKWSIAWPRLENENFIMTIGSGQRLAPMLQRGTHLLNVASDVVLYPLIALVPRPTSSLHVSPTARTLLHEYPPWNFNGYLKRLRSARRFGRVVSVTYFFVT